MLTAAEEWLMEGELKGELKGKMEKEIEIIENLLKVGADWNLIFKATGMDQTGFRKLKEEWSRTYSIPSP